MAYFYFDESIHDDSGFILGAFVCSPRNLDRKVFTAIEQAGFTPRVDEFRSTMTMKRNEPGQHLRESIGSVMQNCKVGLLLASTKERSILGNLALVCLDKIVKANGMVGERHQVWIDEGVLPTASSPKSNAAKYSGQFDIHFDQQSNLI